MSSDLLANDNEAQSGAALNGVPSFQAPHLLLDPQGRPRIYILGDVTDALIRFIIDVGGQVEYRAPNGRSVVAGVPLNKLKDIAARDDVVQMFSASAIRSRTNGYPDQEGDVAHTVDRARQSFSISGAGIKVGVISDSLDDGYGSEATARSSGGVLADAAITIVDSDGNDWVGESGQGNTGEGLPMLEIIHTLAPGAQLFFATGDSGGGPDRMAANIRQLAAAGCRIIVDDLTFPNEPPFQDGPISQAVDDVTAKGVLYFSSAGNSGNLAHHTASTWEGVFTDGGPAGDQFHAGANARLLDFGGKKTLNTIDIASDQDQVNFFWADPLGHSVNGYDLYLVNNKGAVVGQGISSPNRNLDPYLFISGIKGRPNIQGASIVVVKEAAAANVYLHLDVGRGVLRFSTNGATRGHNANGAPGAFSVAATSAPTSLVAFANGTAKAVEDFSADGPRWMFFSPNGQPIPQGLKLSKPDIAAADNVSTTAPTFNKFKGTSAAAPQAAGIAALLLSCNPTAASSQVRDAITSSALPIEPGTPDAGAGIIMAQAAAQKFCPVHAASSGSTSSGQ